MDPLSITASVIALVQLTNKVLSFLNDVKGSSKDREQCTLELSNLLSLLLNLRFRLESGSYDEPWFTAVKALNSENGPLDQYREALEEVQDKITGKSGMRRVGQTLLWKLRKEESASILARVERLETTIQIALELDHFKLSQALKDSINVVNVETNAIKEDTGRLRESDDARQHNLLADWVSSSNYPAQQSDIIREKQDGTGEWFLNSSEFKSWTSTPKQNLFCPGMPGAGKTTISAIAIDFLLSSTQKDNVGIAYIYCNYNSNRGQNVETLLAAILKQLIQAQPSSATTLQDVYKQHAAKGTRLKLSDILKVFLDVLLHFSTIYLIVDALDECPNQDGTRSRFIAHLQDLQSKADIRLMFTSRFILDIQEKFVGMLSLEIRARPEDVKKFVAGRLDHLPKCIQRNNSLQREVESKITQAADGMLLLARLYIDSLRDKNTPRAVRQAIDGFAQSGSLDSDRAYDEAYSNAIERIENQLPGDQELARKVFSWITYAERQLTIAEMSHALAVVPGEDVLDPENMYNIEDAVAVCAGLVTLDEESQRIRLVHYTTQEYFERTRGQWLPDAQLSIALVCLTYLSLSVFRSGPCPNDKDFEARRKEYTLLSYASSYWGVHTAGNEEKVAQQAGVFLQCQSSRESAVQAEFSRGQSSSPGWDEDYSQSYPRHRTALHLIAQTGLTILADHLYSVPMNEEVADAVHEEDSYGDRPLHLAAAYGRCDVTKWLISKGADVNARTKEHETALQAASGEGHKHVVQLLLDRGADVDAHEKDAEALRAASLEGHEQIVQLLLDRGADVNTESRSYGTALQAASLRGHEQIVQLLLDRGADINAQSRFYGTALQAACVRAFECVIQLLLDRGADINSQSEEYSPALHVASERGHERVVQLLLDRGADTNAQDRNFGTALQAASFRGRERVVQLLLDRGTDTEAQGRRFGTALQAASVGGHERVVQLLLDRGADANAQGGEFGSALKAASANGCEQVVRLLLKRGAKMD